MESMAKYRGGAIGLGQMEFCCCLMRRKVFGQRQGIQALQAGAAEILAVGKV